MPGCIESHTKFYVWAKFNVSDKTFQFFWIVEDRNSLKLKNDGAYIFFFVFSWFLEFKIQRSKLISLNDSNTVHKPKDTESGTAHRHKLVWVELCRANQQTVHFQLWTCSHRRKLDFLLRDTNDDSRWNDGSNLKHTERKK